MSKSAFITLMAGILASVSCVSVGTRHLTVNVPGTPVLEASSILTRQERQYSEIKEIQASHLSKIHFCDQIPQGTIRISAPQNVLDALSVENKGETLYISYSQSVTFNADSLIPVITLPSSLKIEAISLCGGQHISSRDTLHWDDVRIKSSGASKIELTLECANISTRISGASSMKLYGRCDNIDITVSGASDIECKNLHSQHASISCSGASKAEIYADKEIEIDCSGASKINVFGDGEIITKNVSGASKVSRGK